MRAAIDRLRPATGPEALAMQYLADARRFMQASPGQLQGFVDMRRLASDDAGDDDPEFPGRHGQSSVAHGAEPAAEGDDRLSIDADAEPEREHTPPYSPQQDRAIQRRVEPSTTAVRAMRCRLKIPPSPRRACAWRITDRRSWKYPNRELGADWYYRPWCRDCSLPAWSRGGRGDLRCGPYYESAEEATSE